MTISAKNYSAQAQRALEEYAAALRHRGSADANQAALVLDLMNGAQHFALPDNGELFEDGLRGLAGQQVRLPFPVVTLEYHIPASEERLPEAPVHASRILIVAAEAPASSVPGEREIAIFSMLYVEDEWLPNLGVFHLSADRWDDYRECERVNAVTAPRDGMPPVAGRFGIWMSEAAESLAAAVGHERAEREMAHNLAAEIYAVLAFCEAMSCSNVSTSVISSASRAVNSRRVRAGKLPINETKVLTVQVPGSAGVRIGAGRKTGDVRQHLRRGHIRRIGDRRVWVNSCVVGNPERGRVNKSYSVQSEAVSA